MDRVTPVLYSMVSQKKFHRKVFSMVVDEGSSDGGGMIFWGGSDSRYSIGPF